MQHKQGPLPVSKQRNVSNMSDQYVIYLKQSLLSFYDKRITVCLEVSDRISRRRAHCNRASKKCSSGKKKEKCLRVKFRKLCFTLSKLVANSRHCNRACIPKHIILGAAASNMEQKMVHSNSFTI